MGRAQTWLIVLLVGVVAYLLWRDSVQPMSVAPQSAYGGVQTGSAPAVINSLLDLVNKAFAQSNMTVAQTAPSVYSGTSQTTLSAPTMIS